MYKSFTKFLLVGLFLAFICQPSLGQIEFPVEKHVLDNGMTVLISEDNSAPVVSYQVWFNVGSKNERPGITGISHLCEHMMFKGSKNIGPEEHTRIIQANGGIDNAGTHFDFTMYWEKLSSDKLELAISLEAERLKHLTPTEETFSSEREVVKEERRMAIDNSPYGALFEQALNTAYVAHPYHWHVIGFMSDIDNITLNDLKEYYRRHYTPSNATAVVIGDVNPKEVMKLINKYYGDIPYQPPPPEVGTVEPEQREERIAYVHKIGQMPAFIVGYHIPEFGHPDIYPLTVAARILFTGESSRLYHKMVYQDQSALAVMGDCFSLEDPGLFFTFAIMQPGHTAEEGQTTLYEQIEKFKEEPVDPNELAKAKNQLESEFIFGLQSVSDKGNQIGYYQTILGDYTRLFDEAGKYQAVTAEDVMRVAKTYFDSKNRTVAVLVPEAADLAHASQKELYEQKAPENVTEDEDRIIAEIKKEGVKDRFLIKEIKPHEGVSVSRGTIKSLGPHSMEFNTEFSEDIFMVGVGSGGLSPDIWGEGSIHRFDGRVEIEILEGKYISFISEGDRFNRLTFLLHEEGYVYVRGKGKVILPNGEEIKLGY